MADDGITKEELIKQLENFKPKGYFIDHLAKFFDGNIRLKKSKKSLKEYDLYHVELSFPIKDMLSKKCKGLPMKKKDFTLLPILVFLNIGEDE